MLSIHLKNSRLLCGGSIGMSASRTAFTAASASGRQLTHHCGFITGSMMSPEREHTGTVIGLSFVSTYSPFSLSASMTARRALKRFMPAYGPAWSLSVPSSLRMLMKARSWRLPTS